jgi:predicted ArsR family transcriptional regulator
MERKEETQSRNEAAHKLEMSAVRNQLKELEATHMAEMEATRQQFYDVLRLIQTGVEQLAQMQAK